jgi:hypothetical protein
MGDFVQRSQPAMMALPSTSVVPTMNTALNPRQSAASPSAGIMWEAPVRSALARTSVKAPGGKEEVVAYRSWRRCGSRWSSPGVPVRMSS